ncbi:hypothetical protein HDU78_004732 [Chytriomyces hyalinus]|nr:hypothetical protein HDU78_004732 [Chytriomyces hyalinus]
MTSRPEPTAASNEKHPLSLKVMRLSRPSLSSLSFSQALSVESNTQNILSDSLQTTPISLSDSLSLPPSFGTIFLGETFSSYLCIVNESNAKVSHAAIRAELQTQTQRFTLADTLSAGYCTLAPSKSAEFLIHHEIKELGVHILVCSVHYATPTGESKSFRKFYKFQVLNPLSVKTKVHTLVESGSVAGESNTGDGTRIFLEAQVQNVAGIPMFLETMRFEPHDLFQFVDMSVEFEEETGDGKSTKKQSVFSDTNLLNDRDSRQYLFALTSKKPNDPIAKVTPTLGKLDIQWRTTLGQQGRLQTSQLSRKMNAAAGGEAVRVEVRELPKLVCVEAPFTLPCRLWNNSASDTIDATVLFVKSRMSSVLLLGPSERAVGVVAPESYIDFSIDFFPLLSGVQKVTGLRVLDGKGGTLDVDVLCEVTVE